MSLIEDASALGDRVRRVHGVKGQPTVIHFTFQEIRLISTFVFQNFITCLLFGNFEVNPENHGG